MILILSLFSPLFVSCNQNNNPLGIGDPNGPIINAGITRQTIVLDGVVGTPSFACQVVITDHNGTPLAADGVTLIAPGPVTVALTPGITGYYSNAGTGGWAFTPGQSYTMKVSISGTTYSGSITLPGGVTIPPFTSPGPIVWAHAGNEDTVTTTETFSPYTSHIYGPVASSGSISTASSTYFPASGTYSIQVNVIKSSIGAFGSNANTVAVLTGTDQLGGTYTK